jgi:hypothetical protein
VLDLKTYPAPNSKSARWARRTQRDNDKVVQSGYACLGSYHAKTGYAAYPLRAQIDPERHRAVALWNREYRVNFTTAPLAQ